MPGKPGPHWQFFYKDNNKNFGTDKSHKAAWCMACFDSQLQILVRADQAAQLTDPAVPLRSEAVLRREVFEKMDPICGKVDLLIGHLRECSLVSYDVKRWAIMVPTSTEKRVMKKDLGDGQSTMFVSHDLPSGSSRFQSLPPTYQSAIGLPSVESPPTFISSPSPGAMLPTQLATSASSATLSAPQSPAQSVPLPTATPWTRERITAFQSELCKVFISRNWAWSSVQDSVFTEFLSSWIPGCPIPSAELLSGSLLSRESAKVEANMKCNLGGKFATGQCDGWKNITKASLVASLVTVESQPYLIKTHDISDQPKTADTLLSLILLDIQYCTMELGLQYIALCSDAGGDSASMRRKAVQKFPWLIVLDCWAHQLNLVVGDYFKLKLTRLKYVDMATELIKWFNNHSQALGLLKAQQLTGNEGQTPLVLFLPVLTRWTSHFLAIRRLLQLKRFIKACVSLHYERLIKAAGTRCDARNRAKLILGYVENESFWAELEKVCYDLQPLAIATNVAQASGARLDQILITLARSYHTYSHSRYDLPVQEGVQRSLSLRWRKNADRKVFILAVFFNPYYRNLLFRQDNPALTPAALFTMATEVGCRVLKVDHLCPQFDASFWAYIEDRGAFSGKAMSLDRHKEVAAYDKATIDICRIWRSINTTNNEFVKLALMLSSVVPNSASAERVFSQMGIIHTRTRNRLQVQKVHKTVMVRMELRRSHNHSEERLKRNFDEISRNLPIVVPDPSPAPCIPKSSSTTHSGTARSAPPNPASDIDTDSESEDDAEQSAVTEPFLAAEETLAATVTPLVEEATSVNPDKTSAARTAAANAIPDSEQLELCNLFDFERLESRSHLATYGEHDKLDAESDLYVCVTAGAEVDLNYD